jgi:hypothetical protein
VWSPPGLRRRAYRHRTLPTPCRAHPAHRRAEWSLGFKQPQRVANGGLQFIPSPANWSRTTADWQVLVEETIQHRLAVRWKTNVLFADPACEMDDARKTDAYYVYVAWRSAPWRDQDSLSTRRRQIGLKLSDDHRFRAVSVPPYHSLLNI